MAERPQEPWVCVSAQGKGAGGRELENGLQIRTEKQRLRTEHIAPHLHASMSNLALCFLGFVLGKSKYVILRRAWGCASQVCNLYQRMYQGWLIHVLPLCRATLTVSRASYLDSRTVSNEVVLPSKSAWIPPCFSISWSLESVWWPNGIFHFHFLIKYWNRNVDTKRYRGKRASEKSSSWNDTGNIWVFPKGQIFMLSYPVALNWLTLCKL